MSKQLKLDEAQMKKQAATLQKAVSSYRNFARNPFDVELNYLSAMNTDFLAKFETMLENLNDGNPKLVGVLEDIEDMTREIADTFETIDHEAANSMGYSQEG